MGRFEESLVELRTSLRLNPLDLFPKESLVQGLELAGHDDEALKLAQQVLAVDPNDNLATQALGRAYLNKGMYEEAIRVFQNHSPIINSFLGFTYAVSNRQDAARKLLETIPPSDQVQALIWTGLGERSRALDALERMYEKHDPMIAHDLNFRELASLRGEPRFQDLRRKIGLPGRR